MSLLLLATCIGFVPGSMEYRWQETTYIPSAPYILMANASTYSGQAVNYLYDSDTTLTSLAKGQEQCVQEIATYPVIKERSDTGILNLRTVSPPGVVIRHIPQASGLFIGSPSIAVLPDGQYLASHDFFGPESNEHECATAVVYRSSDKGLHWTQLAEIRCMFWPKLFVYRNAVYLLGVEKHHGRIVIRRSDDGGQTWTEPRDSMSGLLTATGQYHTAPMPIRESRGRLWRAFEDASNGDRWGERYSAGVLSIPVDVDLLKADNWTFSNFIPRNPEWLDGKFGGWLEGNVVATREGNLVNILRVAVPECPEKAAIVTVSDDGKTISFDPDGGFINFPGGAKKFTIHFDDSSDTYWSLATVVLQQHQGEGNPGSIRNALALTCSPDLYSWEVRCILLYHPDVAAHGFQYVDWLIEENDIIAVCRTAYDDGIGGARNNHDANFLTFHRFANFRTLQPEDSFPNSPPIRLCE